MTKLKVGDTGTVDGRPARVIATDIKGDWPVRIAVDCGDHEIVREAAPLGAMRSGICFIPTPQKTVRYVNVYKDGPHGEMYMGSSYICREAAEGGVRPGRVACIRIELEEGRYDD